MYTYKLGGMLITDELYHDDLDAMTFGRKDQNELRHHGIKGQSWGKRRFQNEDGSLTAAGRNRYDVGDPKQGVTAYSDTGGRGGSGVRTYKGVSNKSAISTNSQNRYGGASGGGGSIRPNGSPTTRTYGGGTNGSSSYSFEYNEGPGQSAGRSVSNKVKAKVSNTVNSGKKAADNLFGSIGNWASNTANDVGKAATNAWDVVSATARGVADSVGNRLTGNIDRNTAESLRRTADFQEDPNAPFHAMGEQYTPENLRKQAEEYQRKADNSLFGRIGNAAKDVGNAFNDAKNWVGDRAQDVGRAATNVYNDASKAAGDAVNWVGDRARDVGNLVSNQDEKRAAENAQNVADRVLEDAIARSGEYVPDEKGGEDLYIRDYNDAKVVDAADKRAADAQQAYENHPLTKIQNTVNDASKAASNAVSDVGRSIGEGVQKAGDWASNAASDVRDWGAGALDKGRQAFENLFGKSEPSNNDSAQRLSDDIYRSNIQKAESSLSSASTASERENSLRDLVNNYREGRASGIADVRSDTKASYFLDRADNNFKQIDSLSRMLETTDPDSDFGRDLKKQLDEYRIDNDLLVGQFYNNTNAAGRWGPDGINPANKPDNVDQANWDEYVRKNYPLAFTQNSQNNRSSSSNSSMSDKPDGVSEEYWREYTSNGGSRESYDKSVKNTPNYHKNENGGSGLLDDKPAYVSDEYWEHYKANGGTRGAFDAREEQWYRDHPAVSLFEKVDYDAAQKQMNDTLARQNENFANTSVVSGNNTVDTSRPYHFTLDPVSGQTVVVYDDEKRR